MVKINRGPTFQLIWRHGPRLRERPESWAPTNRFQRVLSTPGQLLNQFLINILIDIGNYLRRRETFCWVCIFFHNASGPLCSMWSVLFWRRRLLAFESYRGEYIDCSFTTFVPCGFGGNFLSSAAFWTHLYFLPAEVVTRKRAPLPGILKSQFPFMALWLFHSCNFSYY
jgi:hypothetical protein